MKILAFAASSSRQSINKRLITYAAQLIHRGLLDDATVEILDLNDYEMPIYSIDREREVGIPDLAKEFFDKIGASDALLISYAEHNGFYATAFKNIFDWASRIDMRVYQDKPTVMLATSPGRGGGANVLKTAVASAPHFGNEVLASLAIPSFNRNFDVDRGVLIDAELDAQFRAALGTLRRGP